MIGSADLPRDLVPLGSQGYRHALLAETGRPIAVRQHEEYDVDGITFPMVNNMKTNGHDKPTRRDWAMAGMSVTKYKGQKDGNVVLEIRKSLTKGGLAYKQSVIINIQQLAGLAREYLP